MSNDVKKLVDAAAKLEVRMSYFDDYYIVEVDPKMVIKCIEAAMQFVAEAEAEGLPVHDVVFLLCATITDSSKTKEFSPFGFVQMIVTSHNGCRFSNAVCASHTLPVELWVREAKMCVSVCTGENYE